MADTFSDALFNLGVDMMRLDAKRRLYNDEPWPEERVPDPETPCEEPDEEDEEGSESV